MTTPQPRVSRPMPTMDGAGALGEAGDGGLELFEAVMRCSRWLDAVRRLIDL